MDGGERFQPLAWNTRMRFCSLPESHHILEGEFAIDITDCANIAAHEVVFPFESDIELCFVLLSGNKVVVLEGQWAVLLLEECLNIVFEAGYEVLFDHCAMHLSRGEGQSSGGEPSDLLFIESSIGYSDADFVYLHSLPL